MSNAKLYASLWVITARSDAGCVTKMLLKLDLPALQDRREQQRLLFFYKMVEWLVSAMPIDRPIPETITETRDRLNTYNFRTFFFLVVKTTIENQAFLNYRPFQVPH